jgi:transcriptional regulator with XRE-family HTH domain
MKIDVLQRLVAESGYTKVQIADKCGFTRVTLDNALQGADIKISTVESLARVLGVSPSIFFDDVSEQECGSSIDEYRKEIERLQSLLNKKVSTKVVVEMDVSNDEFVRLGLKDKVIQVLKDK